MSRAMDILIRDTIESYEYANYAAYRADFLSAIETQKFTRKIANLSPQLLNVLNNQQIRLANVDLNAVFQQIFPVLTRLMENTAQGVQAQRAADSQINRAFQEAIKQIEAIQTWAASNSEKVVNKNAIDQVLKVLKTGDNPYQIQNTLMTQMGFMMEDALANTLNAIDFDELGKSLCKEEIETMINNMSFKVNTGSATAGIRGSATVEVDGSKFIVSKKSRFPLVDVTVGVTKDGVQFDIGLSLKSSFRPNARWIKSFSGSWDSLLGQTLGRLSANSPILWGTHRLLTYTKRIDKDIANAIILNNIADIISGMDGDSADYLVYQGKWYPMDKLVGAVTKAVAQGNADIFEIKGALTGKGDPLQREHELRIQALRKKGYQISGVQDRAIVSWVNHVNTRGFGPVTIKYDKSILSALH